MDSSLGKSKEELAEEIRDLRRQLAQLHGGYALVAHGDDIPGLQQNKAGNHFGVTPPISDQLEAEKKERQRAEQNLLESQVRFAGILDIATEAIISVNHEQKIMLFNRGAENIFGYLANEVIDQPLGILLPTKFVDLHQQFVVVLGQAAYAARYLGRRR